VQGGDFSRLPQGKQRVRSSEQGLDEGKSKDNGKDKQQQEQRQEQSL